MTARRDTTRPGRCLSSAACLLSLVTMTACQRPSVEETQTTAVVPVAVETARVGLLRGVIAVTGVVAAAPGAEMLVVAPAAARIAQLPHAEGDRVQKGDVLVRFDIPTLASDVTASRAKVMQAVARVEATNANVKRLSSLLEQGVAAPRDVEDAIRQHAEAEADLEQARSAVEAAVALSARAVVRAPFSGVVAQRFHNPGDLVEAAASDPVLKVIDPSRLQVTAAVPSSDLSRVVVGHPAEVREAGPEPSDESEAATVLTKAPQVDPATSTGNVRLAFSKPTSLAAGMTVQVEIVARGAAERAHRPGRGPRPRGRRSLRDGRWRRQQGT